MYIGRYIKDLFMYPVDRMLSERIDSSAIRTIGLLWGPYRNLTTLTASVLSFHPECQVLNHAGYRILRRRKINFFRYECPCMLDHFLRYALWISRGGSRGDYGGSILKSHAYTRRGMAETYRRRFGNNPGKASATCLLWKEPQRIANYLWENGPAMETVLRRFPPLRFILPVRHPLDCAVSNIRTGKQTLLPGISQTSNIPEVTRAILKEFRQFLIWKKSAPGQFFVLFEHQFTEDMLVALGDFLGLAPDDEWTADSLRAFTVKRKYTHSPEHVRQFREDTDAMFADFPDFARNLHRFEEKYP